MKRGKRAVVLATLAGMGIVGGAEAQWGVRSRAAAAPAPARAAVGPLQPLFQAPAGPRDTNTSPMRLPDLVTLPPGQLSLSKVELPTGIKKKTKTYWRLRLSNTVVNVGAGPLELHGAVSGGGVTLADQHIYHEDGSVTTRPAGKFIFAGHEDHNHWHFGNFATYQLWSIDTLGRPKDLIASSEKVTFCLQDTYRPQPNLPRSPANFVYRCTATELAETQGLSVGWADIYTASLQGQWIDIPKDALKSTNYFLVSRCDNGGLLQESDETNNDAVLTVNIKKDKRRVTVVP